MAISSLPSGNFGAADFAALRKQMFQKADADNDGAIDKNELATMLKNAPKPPGARGGEAPNVDKIFKSLDANGDNKITASEMDAGMAKMMGAAKAMRGGHRHAGGPPPGGAPPAGGGGGAQDAAKAATATKTYDPKDANKDGKVTYAEEAAYALQHPEDATKAESQTSAAAATAAAVTESN